MNIREFSLNLQKVYQEISDTFSFYQASTGWGCLAGCGRCCFHPEVEASLYEMIPMALRIYDEGHIEDWIEKLENYTLPHCPIYVAGENEGQGSCGLYQERPSLCRMFGVAGRMSKSGAPTLSICKFIRQEYQITSDPPNLDVATTPIMGQWMLHLSTLEPRLLQERMPIKDALLKALYKVALYAQYHQDDTPPPAGNPITEI